MTVGTDRIAFVVPAGLDDPALTSGGNVYDRRILAGVAARGIAVGAGWPRPDAAARAALDGALAAVPAGGCVLLDGLVACGVPEIVVPHAARLRLVVLVHLPLGAELGAEQDLDEREGRTLRAAAAVITTSRWSAERVVAGHGLDPARVHVVAPGVDPAPPAPGTDGVGRLLCVGSLTPTKGQDQLLEALSSCWAPGSADPAWHCDLVGPTARDPRFADGVRAAAAGLGDRVRIVGPRTGPALDALYAAADLLVVPSRTEAFGMVVTEALARGIPVVASRVGGIAEALGRAPDGTVPGILAAPGAEGLAEALRRWFDDPALRAQLRRSAAGRRADLDGWDVAAARIGELLGAVELGASRGWEARLSTPGDPVCTPDWLALREPADAAARSTDLVTALVAVRPQVRVIADLGCGSGSMGRWLAPMLPGPQDWRLHDRDEELLARAVAGMPEGAGAEGDRGGGVRAESVPGDLTALTATDLAGTDLVTASALFDLLTADEVAALAQACAGAGCAALLTLSVDGRVRFSPEDPLDARFGEAFDAHQRRRVAGRRLLGPDAGTAAVAAFERAGYTVTVRPSPWLLGPECAPLTEEWLRGRLSAACEQEPALATGAADYLRRRLAELAAGELRVEVGHVDLLAVPGGGS